MLAGKSVKFWNFLGYIKISLRNSTLKRKIIDKKKWKGKQLTKKREHYIHKPYSTDSEEWFLFCFVFVFVFVFCLFVFSCNVYLLIVWSLIRPANIQKPPLVYNRTLFSFGFDLFCFVFILFCKHYIFVPKTKQLVIHIIILRWLFYDFWGSLFSCSLYKIYS